MHSSQPQTQPSTPSKHGQTGSLRRYTWELNEMEDQGFSTGSLASEPSRTLPQPASPELHYEATTHEAWPNESRGDSEQPGGIFSTATDDEGHGMSTSGLENRENIAPEEQELTITFALGPSSPVSTHTVTIYPGSRNEARQRFTVPVSSKVITFDWSITCVERQLSRSNRQARNRPACTPSSRPPLAPLRVSGQGIGKQRGRPRRNMRRSASVGSDRPSAAETGAREMSRDVFEEDPHGRLE
ncbi:hypothetical protein VTG60DRAFT_3689 [Thermothelomyces hinnuleus]